MHIRGSFEKSVQSHCWWHYWRVSRLDLVSSISWRNTHQVTARSVYLFVFGIHLNRGSRVIFNNAPAHTSAVVVAKLMELGFQLVSHPPYSPDLAPSDYYLFPNMKKWLAGKRFYGNEDVIAETNGYFSDLDKSYYSEGINKLEQRWTKCISLKGDYVEK